MAGVHKKGRVGEDGVTRYYDPHKKLWVTEKQIQDEQEANKIIDLIVDFHPELSRFFHREVSHL